MSDTIRKKIDHIGAFEIGVPQDIGWAIAVLHDDHTITRTCKGCGVVTRSAIAPNGRVAEAAIEHGDNCLVFDHLASNNPLTS